MIRKLFVVKNERDLRNVVFLGPSPFNSISYKRVRSKDLTQEQKSRLITYEVCKVSARSKSPCNCEKRCIWAVIKMTPKEQKERKLDLKQLYPLTKF